jgi:hypothetical protein
VHIGLIGMADSPPDSPPSRSGEVFGDLNVDFADELNELIRSPS